MKKLFIVALLMLSAGAYAQDRPSITASANTVFTGADGKFETAPDTAVIQFNIAAQADTAKDAYENASKQAEKMRGILRANGIDVKAAEVGFFSVQPMYDWKNPKRKLIGYTVNTTVLLKLKDFSKVGAVTGQMADADVGQGQSMSYTLEKIDEAKSKAVEDAYHKARMNAEVVARASGRTLGQLSYASVDTFDNPRPPTMMQRSAAPRAMTMAAEAPTEQFSPQNVTVTAHVNVMFELK